MGPAATAPPGETGPAETGGAGAGRDSAADSGTGRDSAAGAGDLWVGERDGEGFGSALAAGDGQIYAGAPGGEGGRVYLLGDGGSPQVLIEEDGAGALGTALAWTEAGLLAGAPLQGAGGALLTPAADRLGALVLAGEEGAVLGGRIIAADGGWVATTTEGVSSGGEALVIGRRPGGLAQLGEGLAVGLPRGEAALWVDGELLPRVEDRDEAGYALCAADLDGDGGTDLAVGAPGAATVYLLLGDPSRWSLSEAPALRGGGRFGQALACGEGRLVVGAPMWGREAGGAVWSFEGPPEGWSVGDPLAAGDAPGDQLGAAVLIAGDRLYVGAPGGAESPGRVFQFLLRM